MPDETAWPFLIGRTRDEDYRFVVIPAVMTDTALTVALRAAAGGGDPGDPETALVREIPVTDGRPYAVVYRTAPARAGDYGLPGPGPLVDGHGRPIVLTEGLVLRRAATSVLQSGLPRAALSQAHRLVTPAFRQFWDQGGGYRRQAAGAFTLDGPDPADPPLRLRPAGPATPSGPCTPAGPATPVRPAGPGRRRAGAKTLLVVGAVTLVLLAGAAALAARLLPHHPASTGAAQAMTRFCDDLQADDAESAYTLTASAFRARVTESAFAADVLPPGSTRASCGYRLTSSPGRSAHAAMTLTRRGAASSWTVTLAAGPGGQWQVTQIVGA